VGERLPFRGPHHSLAHPTSRTNAVPTDMHKNARLTARCRGGAGGSGSQGREGVADEEFTSLDCGRAPPGGREYVRPHVEHRRGQYRQSVSRDRVTGVPLVRSSHANCSSKLP
jgi:hypothetical protein